MTEWAIACADDGPVFHSWGVGVGCWLFKSPELCRAAPWGRSSACCHSIWLALKMTGEWLKPQSLSLWPVP